MCLIRAIQTSIFELNTFASKEYLDCDDNLKISLTFEEIIYWSYIFSKIILELSKEIKK